MKFNAEQGSSKSQGSYLQLGDGKSAIGVFRGEPEVFYQIFENGKYRVVPSTDANGQFKFAVNFIVKENGMLVSKLFQGNWFDYKALEALNEEFPLETTFVKISQTGERQTKRISFMPMTKQKPEEALMSKVELQSITKKTKSVTKSESADPDIMPNFDDDQLPF